MLAETAIEKTARGCAFIARLKRGAAGAPPVTGEWASRVTVLRRNFSVEDVDSDFTGRSRIVSPAQLTLKRLVMTWSENAGATPAGSNEGVTIYEQRRLRATRQDLSRTERAANAGSIDGSSFAPVVCSAAPAAHSSMF